jgi:hypothetical protein
MYGYMLDVVSNQHAKNVAKNGGVIPQRRV